MCVCVCVCVCVKVSVCEYCLCTALHCIAVKAPMSSLCLSPVVGGNLLVIFALAAIQCCAVHWEGQLFLWASVGLGGLIIL